MLFYVEFQTVVLSGKDGSKLSPIFTDSIGSQSSPLSISVAGRGNDIFLHWMSNCKGHDKEALKYKFPNGRKYPATATCSIKNRRHDHKNFLKFFSGYHMHDKMRADICRSLFGEGSEQEMTYLALQRYNASKETLVFSSLWWDNLEHDNINATSILAEKYLKV